MTQPGREFDIGQYRITQEPYYADVRGEVELFTTAARSRMPVMLKGPTGCGKTRFIQHMAFRLGRPYWSGLAEARQYHLHQLDAASALLAAANSRAAGKIYYATDGRAVSFMQFMDAFAHRVGRPKPLHLPPYSQPLARLIIRKEHMQQTALAMPLRAPSPRGPGWKPKFADYRKGLDQVIEAWRDKSSPPVHK